MEAGGRAERELTTEECLGLLDEMQALGTEMLILTGGEPLLRRDIFSIAERASSLGMWVVMGTNGVLVTDRVAGRMVDCGVRGVGISIDSSHPDRHNRFRGGRNAWQHSVRALDICRRQGLEVLVQTTVMDENYEEIPDLLALAQKKGAWAFNLYFLVQTGRGEEMNELDAVRTEVMLERLAGWQNAYRPMLVRAKCAPQFKQIAYAQGLAGLESGGCMAATEYCRITPEGDVTACPYMTLVAGSVLEQSFSDIWHGSPIFEGLRRPDQFKGRCGRCEFNELCGGCRCRAYAATGDYLQEDPACRYEPTGVPLSSTLPRWDEVANARLERIPIAFIRGKTRKGVEAFAGRKGLHVITEDVMTAALSGMARQRRIERLPRQQAVPAHLV